MVDDSDCRGSAAEHPEELLRFVARFDRREYWLAHEELENLWRQDRQDFYKGLIQVAAAFVHLERENCSGARRLMQSALRYLAAYPSRHGGFDLAALRRRARDVLDRLAEHATGEEDATHGVDPDQRPVGGPGFRIGDVFDGEVALDSVETVELPYRARRYEDGYRPGRPGRGKKKPVP